ncbi:MAG TPA: RHS repeat-associated core domain-containing protein [Promineifilum sp.]|nr:RHS repeat-associated core domain-containing protein [Promineifilum sp.]
MPYYILTDHLGNVAAWMNVSGTLVGGSLARYEPFGGYRTKPASTVNPDISDRGFTGHRHNNTGTNDLDLIYMNARYYMPQVGRFISPDTIVPEPGNPQSFNRYSYVNNNPTNFTDPTGHCAEPASFTVCATGAIALGPIGVGIIVGGTIVFGVIAITSSPDAMEFLDNVSQQVGDQVTHPRIMQQFFCKIV